MACSETLTVSGAGTEDANGDYPKDTDGDVGDGTLQWDIDSLFPFVIADTGSRYDLRDNNTGEIYYFSDDHNDMSCPHELNWNVGNFGSSPPPNATDASTPTVARKHRRRFGSRRFGFGKRRAARRLRLP